MKIVGRREWGARGARKGVARISEAARTAFMVHHSGGPAGQSVRSIQDHCMDARGFLDIDYNFLIDQDGEVYQGRGWGKVGSHCVGWNAEALGVCVIGTNQLSAEARSALRELYAEACRRSGHELDELVHSDKAPTACPGQVIRMWVHHGGLTYVRDLRLDSPYMHGKDVEAVQRIVGVTPDGWYGPRTYAAVIRWQHAHGLQADGIVGRKTRAAMRLW